MRLGHKVEREIAGRTLSIETGDVAKQAGGSVWLRQGDTVVMAAATMSKEARSGIDFFPLTCDYEERKYAVGKIPGGFIKRGGRPSEKAILTSRMIDRPLRPLFPYGMRNDVQVIAMPLSVDLGNLPDVLAMTAASAALAVSDIPWDGPVGAVRIGRIDGEFVVNPSQEQMAASTLDLVVAGTAVAVIMVEAGATFESEADVLAAIDLAHSVIRDLCAMQTELASMAGKTKKAAAYHGANVEILDAIRSRMAGEIRAAIQNPDKAARESAIDDLKEEITQRLLPDFPDAGGDIPEAAEKAVKEQIRALIIEESVRPDGRKLDEVRAISCRVGLLPRVHGTGMFTRGQTQVLTALTLGSKSDAQIVDNLEVDEKKPYMHYYNFPPYSVGECRQMRGPGRREIGHGALAERAMIPVLPPVSEFPYAILLQSEVLESNGSTSMASVCGSSLALMDAGVPISHHVAGVAMGLMSSGDKYAVLTDIQGMEDFSGDMDFKVAGTAEGITAIQMDTKIQGIPRDVLVRALEQARQGRLHILGKLNEAISAPRESLSPYAPSIFSIQINPERIGEVIGPGGKTIKRITAETGAQIDIEQDGTVYIAAVNQEAGRAAADAIRGLVSDIELGTIYEGRVTRVIGMGAFVEILPGKEGLVHTSNLASPPVRRPDDAVKVGDPLKVRVIEVDGQGRVNLSAIQLDEPFSPEMARRPDDGRGGGGGRFGGDRRGGGDRDRGDRFSHGPREREQSPRTDDQPVDETPRVRFRPRR
ncbi:MAG: polyribonucleotide nucleotidyltransferase [Armatimonadetes bacterium]|nr:polyribonucleotide nucleotidyltransferase [Armatimonadota bacterium]MDE2205543.1 polyribonucleotide nucleotidyltransferase [Armatimonadota bacterium]